MQLITCSYFVVLWYLYDETYHILLNFHEIVKHICRIYPYLNDVVLLITYVGEHCVIQANDL